MLVLDNTMMGIMQLNPKEILVDGLRKELCRKLATMLNFEFIFVADAKKKGQTVEKQFYNKDEVNAKGIKI